MKDAKRQSSPREEARSVSPQSHTPILTLGPLDSKTARARSQKIRLFCSLGILGHCVSHIKAIHLTRSLELALASGGAALNILFERDLFR